MKAGELKELLESVEADTPIITGYEESEDGEGYIVITGIERVTLENGLDVLNFTQDEVQTEDEIEEDGESFSDEE